MCVSKKNMGVISEQKLDFISLVSLFFACLNKNSNIINKKNAKMYLLLKTKTKKLKNIFQK